MADHLYIVTDGNVGIGNTATTMASNPTVNSVLRFHHQQATRPHEPMTSAALAKTTEEKEDEADDTEEEEENGNDEDEPVKGEIK